MEKETFQALPEFFGSMSFHWKIDTKYDKDGLVEFSDTLEVNDTFETSWGSDDIVRGLTKRLKVDKSTIFNDVDNKQLHHNRFLLTEWRRVGEQKGYAQDVAVRGVKWKK